VKPITAPELPMVELAHDSIELLDVGTVISGLTPALSISVEPSGIVPPFNVKFEFVPMDESDETVPVDVGLLTDAQVEVIDEPNPPPSKTEPAMGIEAIPDPLDPVMPEEIPEYAAALLVLQSETGAGLKPPGSISIAPSGIPVGLLDPLDALEPSMPSGDVAPMPVLIITFCAWAAPQPNMIAANARGTIFMERLRGYA
jgi:hypothetical protein